MRPWMGRGDCARRTGSGYARLASRVRLDYVVGDELLPRTRREKRKRRREKKTRPGRHLSINEDTKIRWRASAPV